MYVNSYQLDNSAYISIHNKYTFANNNVLRCADKKNNIFEYYTYKLRIYFLKIVNFKRKYSLTRDLIHLY